MEKKFTWLHISDLHVGAKSQSWLWPQVKEALFDDIPLLLRRTGPLDAVIFTGDLTQSGSREQYADLTKILLEFWSVLRANGSTPKLLALPGNHDLQRPDANDPAARVLRSWPVDDQITIQTLNKPDSPYRKLLDGAFQNYSDWCSSLSGRGIELVSGTSGVFPGDFSAELVDGGVGVIGLNSAWLQLEGGDYEGRLYIEPRQLLTSVSGEPRQWVDRHWFNLIATHHPASWLSADGNSLWESTIAPAGRFNLHVHGHMHDNDAVTISRGGSPARRAFQAPSLFGLEKYEDKHERKHGYAAGQATLGESGVEIRIWPRRHQRLASGGDKIVPAVELDLNEDQYFVLPKDPSPTVPATLDLSKAELASAPTNLPVPITALQGANVLDKVRYHLPPSPASLNVRKIEQRQCLESLRNIPVVWLVSEWGSGVYGFLWSVQKGEPAAPAKTYRISLDTFTSRENFLANLKDLLGLSFEQFCSEVSNIGDAYLLFEDYPFHGPTIEAQNSLVADLEDVAATVLQYAPNLRIIIVARKEPTSHAFTSIHLNPLDEDDVLTYVAEHDKGGPAYTSVHDIGVIYRHTDGVPARIDTALRALEVVTIEQLGSTNRDIHRSDATIGECPVALKATIDELANSKEPIRQRAYLLLKALSCFPQGETIERVKRFFDKQSLQHSHALELIDSSLLSSVSRVEGIAPEQTVRLLVVPKTVRDFVRGQLKPSEWHDLSRRAAVIYFGEKWHEGSIRQSALNHYKGPAVPGTELANASTILVRLLISAMEESSGRDVEAALGMTTTYIRALSGGAHYRAVVNLYEEIATHIPNGYAEKTEIMRSEYANCLRMISEIDAAKEVSLSLLDSDSNVTRQDAYLNISLCEKAHGNLIESVDAANRARAINKSNAQGQQARVVILEQTKAKGNEAELLRIENRARARGNYTVANNLAITRAQDWSTPDEDAEKAISAVLISAAKDKDYYNGVRALAERAKRRHRNGKMLSESDQRMLIGAYHYVFNERMKVLFDNVSASLWNSFEQVGDSKNLLKLFRQSSLVWRLRGDATLELTHLEKLSSRAGSVVLYNGRGLDREAAYYLARVASTIGKRRPEEPEDQDTTR